MKNELEKIEIESNEEINMDLIDKLKQINEKGFKLVVTKVKIEETNKDNESFEDFNKRLNELNKKVNTSFDPLEWEQIVNDL